MFNLKKSLDIFSVNLKLAPKNEAAVTCFFVFLAIKIKKKGATHPNEVGKIFPFLRYISFLKRLAMHFRFGGRAGKKKGNSCARAPCGPLCALIGWMTFGGQT